MLGAGPRDTDRVTFLECVIANEMRRDLSREHDQRNGIHQCIGKSRDGVRGPGARRYDHDPRPAGRARIAFRSVDRSLLVSDENVLEVLGSEQRVVDGKNRAAWVSENVLYALVLQRTNHHLGAAQFDSPFAGRDAGAAQCCLILVHDRHSSLLGPEKRKGRCRPLVTSRRSETRSPSPAQRPSNKYVCSFQSRHSSVRKPETTGGSIPRQAILCEIS
jgi:hypothetical protein